MLDIFGYKFKTRDVLIVIVLAGAILRFWGLGTAEIFHDEGFYAFRSIGYLDYIQNDSQTTPVQWFANSALPTWTHLSFHDGPPFFFLIQNLFFKIFGDSLFSARLPSVLAGLGSIILIFFIARKLFKPVLPARRSFSEGGSLSKESEYAGLLAALLLAVNHIHSWISRSSLMESIQILAILACIYLFWEFYENRKKWVWFGAALGVSFLIKYTSAFLIPVFIVYLLIYDRKILKSWQLYSALLIALALFTPVLVYNFNLYQSVGHFDLQFSYLFRQATPEWQASFGKVQEPFSNLVGNLIAMYSIPFLLLAASGFALGIRRLFIKEKWAVIAISSVIMITLMLVAVGSAYRFIALYSPFFVILAVAFLLWLAKRLEGVARSRDAGFREEKIQDKNIFIPLLIVFILYELLFTIDGIFWTFPDFGVVKLDQYFDQVFNSRRPAFPPNSSNPHLNKIIQENLSNYSKSDTPAMLIYDENIGLSARLWVFTRRIYYHGIPAVTTGQFKALLRSSGAGTLKDYKIYFVKASQYTSLNPYFSTPDSSDFEVFLQESLSIKPVNIITGYQELPMFSVYEFSM